MGAAAFVRYELAGAVARITIARPEVHNAFNEDVISQLHSAFLQASSDEAVRVVVLAGDGRTFSAGADLDWMRRAADYNEEENRRDAAALAAMLRSVAECSRPVVARVQGGAFGGGAGLVAASDIAIAAQSAKFGFPEVRLGLVPATIAPHVVEKIGVGHTLPLFLTGERFDAERALAIGLVHRVVPDRDLDSEVEKTVASLLEAGPYAQAVCKGMVRRASREDASSVDAYSAALIASVRSGPEALEGVRAFLEKRRPGWAHIQEK
jgi:methylglutaconyl-CoA hydratase